MKQLIKLVVVLTILLSSNAYSQPPFAKNAADAQVFSADIKNFIEAYDKMSGGEDETKILQTLYFERGSPGLKEYVKRFGLTPELLAKAIKEDPGTYRKLKLFYEKIPDFEAKFRADLAAYKKVYPKAMFAPTYLLVGANRGIGQASGVGQLVSVEKASASPEKLRVLMVHEVTHFQQAVSMGMQTYTGLYSQKNNMLGMVLREGAAEFVTYKLVKKNENEFSRLMYYKNKEAELWKRFKSDLARQNKDFWLGLSREGKENDEPILLGYAVGFRVVEAYFEKVEDKARALDDIMSITDPQAILEKSGYDPAD